MSQLSNQEMDKLIKLSRIECTAEEKEKLQNSLSGVLDYINLLNEINTDGVETCYTVQENSLSPLREDEVGETLPRELFLANAPAQVGGMIRVPPVIKTSNP